MSAIIFSEKDNCQEITLKSLYLYSRIDVVFNRIISYHAENNYCILLYPMTFYGNKTFVKYQAPTRNFCEVMSAIFSSASHTMKEMCNFLNSSAKYSNHLEAQNHNRCINASYQISLYFLQTLSFFT